MREDRLEGVVRERAAGGTAVVVLVVVVKVAVVAVVAVLGEDGLCADGVCEVVVDEEGAAGELALGGVAGGDVGELDEGGGHVHDEDVEVEEARGVGGVGEPDEDLGEAERGGGADDGVVLVVVVEGAHERVAAADADRAEGCGGHAGYDVPADCRVSAT